MIHYVIAPSPDVSSCATIEEVRYVVAKDMLTNGVPRKHFSELIELPNHRPGLEYKFRGEVYQFELDILDKLNIFGNPFKGVTDKTMGNYNVPHYLNLAATHIDLPCWIKSDEETPTFFRAQHKAATELLNIWFDFQRQYVELYNDLIDALNTVEAEQANMVVGTYYGTEPNVPRILF